MSFPPRIPDNLFFVLDDNHQPVPTNDWKVLGAFRSDEAKCRVDYTDIAPGIKVSTIFLGVNTSLGKPVLFETMVFGGALNREQWRYHTWDEAVAGHAAVVELARAAQAKQA